MEVKTQSDCSIQRRMSYKSCRRFLSSNVFGAFRCCVSEEEHKTMDQTATSKESQSRNEDEYDKTSPDRQEKPEEGGSGNDLENQVERLPYPKSVGFIISNEFCERFSFYGMRTILALYLKNKLHFSTTTATALYHVFIMICYFFPIMGAIVADSWLGKFRTILYLSVVYAFGQIVVSIAAIPDTIPPTAFTMIGLVLVALGTGGIKPCVSAFGGDQFILPQQEDQLQKFFSLFYFAINCGSFVSTFLTPVLREQVKCFGEDSCYSLAFGVPAILMILSIVIYISGKSFYKIKEPEGNVVVKVAQCVLHASRSKSSEKTEHWLDKAQDRYEKSFIDDIKATFRVLVLYIPLPIFWALFDQQGSRWTFQAERMNGEIGNFKIEPDQLQLLNPVLILVFIPLFQTVLYPLLAKCNILKRPLQRLTVGGLLAAASFGISAIVEINLEPTYPVLPQPQEGQIRLYNALPLDVDVKFPDREQFTVKSFDFWEDLHIPVKTEMNLMIDVTPKGKSSKKQEITIYENSATSYTIRPISLGSIELLKIENENVDKADNGNPKIMVIYSDPKPFGEKSISIIDSGDGKDMYWKSLNYTKPFVEYTKIKLSTEKYILRVDEEEVLKDIEMKQGGVYVALITKTDEKKHSGIVLTVTKPNSVHMLWLIPQYVVITAGEVMFSITGLEFSFTQAPATMKALLQAAWLLTVAIGNLVVVIVAEAKIFKSQTYEFLLFGGLMFLDMLVFALMAMRYKYVEDLQVENETELDEHKGEEKGQ